MSYDMRQLSIEELRMLAEAERQMDRGEVPWVRVEGIQDRSLMNPEVMSMLGLVTGQTISWTLFGEILKLNLELLNRQIDYEKAQPLIQEVMSEDKSKKEN